LSFDLDRDKMRANIESAARLPDEIISQLEEAIFLSCRCSSLLAFILSSPRHFYGCSRIPGKAYIEKSRRIVSNLKNPKNEVVRKHAPNPICISYFIQLRARLLRGEFTPSSLASMSVNDLASKALRDKRKEWERFGQFAC
jgi:hypothetical protein